MIDISLSPRRVVSGLAVVVATLVLGHVVGLVFKYGFQHESVFNLVPLFDLRIENNFPTYYSSVALLLSASLLLFIAIAKRRLAQPFAVHWFFLGLVFAFLACDEIMTIHEESIRPMREIVDASGIFYFAWIIPYGAAVVVLGLAYIRFLRALPRPFGLWFIGAAMIYLMGAIGFESLSAQEYYENGSLKSSMFVLWYSLEEFFEMVGIVVFIYGLTSYITDEMNGLRITIGPAETR